MIRQLRLAPASAAPPAIQRRIAAVHCLSDRPAVATVPAPMPFGQPRGRRP